MKFRAINPATEEVIKEYEGMSCEDARRMAKAGRAAQAQWAHKSLAERCVLIKKLGDRLRAGIEADARLMTQEMGKPIKQARAEAEKCALLCDFYADSTMRFLAPEEIATEAKKSYVRLDPLGVILGIMPWNFPFWQVFRFAVPALAAGNGTVLKHASNVPGCALRIQELFEEAGFPKGLFQTFLIDSAAAMQLIEDDAIAAVSLTGSTQAGAQVAETAGRALKKCVLELGGSDAFIVLADADLEKAAAAAVQARIINNGQSCIAAKRFIVEQAAAAAFEEKVTAAFKKLKMGDPLDEDVTVGPLAKEEIREGLEKQLKDALSKGARILCGGAAHQGKGFFFEPTLITNISEEMSVYRDEVFGPIMPINPVQNAEAAVALANSSSFGLGASVWTADLVRAEGLAARIESGFVAINGIVKSDPRLPFGGIKKSGFGRELGSYGIKEFVNVKTVVIN